MDKIYTVDYIISKDKTKISYRVLGNSNIGIILVHGGIMSSENFMELGKILSNKYTVYIVERRGRKLSQEYDNQNLELEVEDIQAIINKTNAEYIFGLSSGAIISLQTAITEKLKKIAIYVPAISDNWSINEKWYVNYENAIKQNNYGKAFLYVMNGLGEKSFITILPKIITIPLLNFMINKQETKEDETSLKDLIRLFVNDFRIVIDSKGMMKKCKSLNNRDVLLMTGEKTQKIIKEPMKKLKETLPNAEYIELKGCRHNSADNTENPFIIAKILENFFSR